MKAYYYENSTNDRQIVIINENQIENKNLCETYNDFGQECLNRSAREVIGEFLKSERIKKKITKYAITKQSGLHPSIVNAIESGSRDYFMSSFLTYCQQIDAYIFFGNKEGKSDSAIDQDHMISEIKKK